VSIYFCLKQLVLTRKRRSLADQDSDRWIFEVLAPDIRRKLKDNKGGSEWTDLVLAHSHKMLLSFSSIVFAEPKVYVNSMNKVVPGKISREHSESCPLRVHPRDGFPTCCNALTLHQHPAMIRGVKTIKAAAKPQTTFLCLSSANNVFISTILEVRVVVIGRSISLLTIITSRKDSRTSSQR